MARTKGINLRRKSHLEERDCSDPSDRHNIGLNRLSQPMCSKSADPKINWAGSFHYLADTLLPAGSPTDFKYSIVSEGIQSFSSKI